MDYLENLLNGNIAAFRKQIEGKLAEKVFDKLATRKQQIANSLFEEISYSYGQEKSNYGLSKPPTQRVISDKEFWNDLSIVTNPSVTHDVLHRMAKKHSDPYLLKEIALHKNAHEATLHAIAKKTNDTETHFSLLRNPNTRGDTLKIIAKNSFKHGLRYPYLQNAILAHKNVDDDVREEILKNPVEDNELHGIVNGTNDPELLRTVARHPESSEHVLNAIARKTNDPEVIATARKHPNIDSYTFDKIIKNKKNPKLLESFNGLFEAKEESGHTKTAYDWHGGQWSPLYSFASTGGKVHSEEHRKELKNEIEKNMDWAKDNDKKEYPKLKALHDHISKAPLTNSKNLKEASEDEKEKNPRLKLIKTHTEGNKTAKVYKDLDYDEHRVKFYTDGKHHKDADYFEAGDKEGAEEAHRTAKAWLKNKK